MEDHRKQHGKTGFAHQPSRPKTVFTRHRQRECENRRMQMQMRVTVPISRRESKRAKARELRADFPLEQRPNWPIEKITASRTGRRRREIAPLIRERRNTRSTPRAKRKMQANAERRMAACDAHGFVRSGFINHEACLRQKAGFNATLDRFVDFMAATEVVGGEDELFQSADGALSCALPR